MREALARLPADVRVKSAHALDAARCRLAPIAMAKHTTVSTCLIVPNPPSMFREGVHHVFTAWTAKRRLKVEMKTRWWGRRGRRGGWRLWWLQAGRRRRRSFVERFVRHSASMDQKIAVDWERNAQPSHAARNNGRIVTTRPAALHEAVLGAIGSIVPCAPTHIRRRVPDVGRAWALRAAV